MATFLLTFALLITVVVGLAVGAIFKGKTIQGSCGGLNGVTDGGRCLVCKKPVDSEGRLSAKMNCPRAQTQGSE
ncbi:MAG: (Na+)-NQR maturation NqrM [Sphingomonadales bacterium]